MIQRKENKTIAITLRFYTNNMELIVGGEKQLACWDCGGAAIEANKDKGIKAAQVQFANLEDAARAIKHLLRRAGVKVVSDNRRGICRG